MRADNRAFFINFVIVTVFLIFIMRLWQLQLLQGKEYRKLSEQNRLRIIKLPAPRGIIYDRNGNTLVKNMPYYTASLAPADLEGLKVYELAGLLGLSPEDILRKLRRGSGKGIEPVVIREGLTFTELAALEARRSDFPNLIIETDVSREYPYGDIGAHVIGYLGKLNPAQSRSPEFNDVPSQAFIGQWGAERLFDRVLRGTPGERIIEVDALGKELRLLQENMPEIGDDLTLSLDINLQKAAEEAFDRKTGALVALKPDTGEVLGFVSKPSFDPNRFSKGIGLKEWVELSKDRGLPMLNRALQSQYPPGSTFKIVTAIAALEEGLIDLNTKVTCSGGINYGRWRFGCWRKEGHGTISLHRAIVESCDVYFYEAGKRLGIDRIAKYAYRLGFGKESGLQLVTERKGLIPDTKWKKEKKNLEWYLGDTFNSAIGQGYIAVTPVQMAQLIAIVANKGYPVRPVIQKIPGPLADMERVDIKQETFEIIKKALFGVVNETGGTGWASRSEGISIGGKTGTAQVVSIRKDSHALPEMFRDHAWFVAFAERDKPEIALSVMVEHGGHGGAASAPIAKKTIEAYLMAKPKGSE